MTDLAGVAKWVQDECARRGLVDQNAVMRKVHDAIRKASKGASVQSIQREAIEELQLDGLYAPGEKTFEERTAEQEKAKPTPVQMWRSAERKDES